MTGPLVAIVGRPNVGKSTLFNRLVGQSLAIVSDTPGTTRDRVTASVSWGDRVFTLVDTGGLETAPVSSDMWDLVREQVEVAMEEADAIVFLVDVMSGITPADREIAQSLRQMEKPLLLVVNKVDNARREQDAVEFHGLGLGNPVFMSAYHNLGIDEFFRELEAILPFAPEEETEEMPRLAIVGRPNVGKSQLLNAILGHQRSIVSETPGTTRDAIDTTLTFNDRPITLIDTAGVRRRGRIERGIEKYSVLRAVRAIERSNVCILVTDATESITGQDTHVAGQVLDTYKGVVIVVNKWDMVEGEAQKAEALREVRRKLKFIPYAPVCFTSALNGDGVRGVVETAIRVYREGAKIAPRGALERALMEALAAHPPPTKGSRSLKVYRIYQKGTHPPTFILPVNNPELVHFSYQRYLENRLRDTFGFAGNPLHLVFPSSRGGRL